MRVAAEATLPFYTQPGSMTSVGRFAREIDKLPRDVAGLAAVGHGLLVHEHIAPAYGVELSDADRASVHVRPVERLLELIAARDSRPFDAAREPATRLAGNCRHFTVLMVAMLRAHGTPARARCGFGNYFAGADVFEDHWVCEYWDAHQRRWALVDAQIDDRQHAMFGIDFDLTDVPRDRFLTAGDAWARCRAGTADPDKFGLSILNEAGYWWIAGNLMRDAAARSTSNCSPGTAGPRCRNRTTRSTATSAPSSTTWPRSPAPRTPNSPGCGSGTTRMTISASPRPSTTPS